MKIIQIISLLVLVVLTQSCSIIRPGEVAVDIHFGKVKPEILQPGIHHTFALFGRKIVRYNTREINYSVALVFHTKEGIDVNSEITVLYHVNPDSVINIYNKFGREYQQILVQDNITAALRQTGLQYSAIELKTQRTTIESTIFDRLTDKIGSQGFVIHSVMIKKIDLPDQIEATVTAQLNAVETAKRIKLENETSREQLAFQLEKSKKDQQQQLDNQRLQLEYNIDKEKQEINTQRLQLDFNIEKQKKENELTKPPPFHRTTGTQI